MKTDTQIPKNGIFVSALGCVAGTGLFFLWLLTGTHWHPEQPILLRLEHPPAALTVACWVSAALLLPAAGAVLLRGRRLGTSVFIAASTWISLGLFLAYATPYTTRTCFQSPYGTYGCHQEDLVFKALAMVCSLLFPALLGVQLRNVAVGRVIRGLK